MGLAYLILIVSLLPATIVFARVRINVRAREEARLKAAVRDLQAEVDRQFTDVTHVLWGIRGLFIASKQVKADEWNLFLDSVEFSEESTGFRDLGFAIRVPSTNLQTHLTRQRAERQDYKILPPGEREEFFPIIFLRDKDIGNLSAFGWDPYQNKVRRAAMDQARDTGDPIATELVQMALPNGDFVMAGHVVYFPVYRSTVQPATVEERRSKLIGFVFASFRDEQLWQTTLPRQADPALDVEIFNATGKLVGDRYPERASDSPRLAESLVVETPFEYFGQRWTMRTTTLPKFANPNERYLPEWVLLGCASISMTLFLLAGAQAKGRAAAELLAEQRRRAEAALQSEKERLAVTLRSIADGVITTDLAGKIVLLNNAAEAITGWKQAEGIARPISEVFSILDENTREKIGNPAESALSTGEVARINRGAILKARDGVERIVAASAACIRGQDGEVVGAALVFRDITEKRRFEAELLNASKLESVGLLAGGIAHDFNNILSIILGNLSICKMTAPPAGPFHERLAQAEKGCVRARELTQQLLTFAKGGAPIRKATSIAEVVHESAAFAARGSNIVCKQETEAALWPVEVDDGQISRVFNNLVINAVQAMPNGGTLWTRMKNFVVTESSGLPLQPGRYVQISVEDTGTGIEPEHIGRIFDPYFSTKKSGSGLGLATTYAIIQKHDGCITVQSALGKGTTFHIYLPASDSTPLSRQREPQIVPGAGGRVLVMDDETAILDVARMSLTHLGYEVETAEHGDAAIAKFEAASARGRPFTAVIMDLTVPGGIGGKEAMKRLLEIDPQVRAIVSSGYSHDPVMANYREFGFAGVVEKPYQVDVLARALASVLQEVGK